MGQLLDILAADAAGKRAQADAAFRAIRAEQAVRAERAALNSAGQAINAALRPCYPAAQQEAVQALAKAAADDDSFESMQPLWHSSVMVCYSFDGTDLSIDGATINGDFVHIDCFTSVVRGQWYRAILAEERKSAEIESWGE